MQARVSHGFVIATTWTAWPPLLIIPSVREAFASSLARAKDVDDMPIRPLLIAPLAALLSLGGCGMVPQREAPPEPVTQQAFANRMDRLQADLAPNWGSGCECAPFSCTRTPDHEGRFRAAAAADGRAPPPPPR